MPPLICCFDILFLFPGKDFPPAEMENYLLLAFGQFFFVLNALPPSQTYLHQGQNLPTSQTRIGPTYCPFLQLPLRGGKTVPPPSLPASRANFVLFSTDSHHAHNNTMRQGRRGGIRGTRNRRNKIPRASALSLHYNRLAAAIKGLLRGLLGGEEEESRAGYARTWHAWSE